MLVSGVYLHLGTWKAYMRCSCELRKGEQNEDFMNYDSSEAFELQPYNTNFELLLDFF